MKNTVKKKKKYNTNLVKARHSYTLKEIAELFNLHTRTIQSWRKDGLGVIDEESKPFLVIGEEIKRFLKERSKRRKYPLKPEEFFCTKCQAPRRSQTGLYVEITGRKLGKVYKQALIKGICSVCEQQLLLFSSDRKIAELKRKGVLFSEHKRTILSNEDSSLNAYIARGENGKG